MQIVAKSKFKYWTKNNSNETSAMQLNCKHFKSYTAYVIRMQFIKMGI